MKKAADPHISWLPYMARTTNYNKWIFNMYREYVGNSVLDIGAGLGTFVDFIKHGRAITILETSTQAIRKLRTKYKRLKNIEVIKGDLSSPISHLPSLISKKKINTVICLNTLEHVKNDKTMLANIRRCLRPKGKLILYVPALKALFGTLDINLGHVRRYSKSELERMLKRCGFKIIESRYVNFIGLFSWFLYSRILKRKRVKEKRLLFYDKWFILALSKIERLIPPPFGQSLFVVAENK
jgi:2-polyprenyl-3-methyl-5-hydroxy-6-metoxy-1,4-benzoquinol methylase